MHNRNYSETPHSKLFQQLEQGQRAAAVETAGGLVEE
jgi:hypothetical protein